MYQHTHIWYHYTSEVQPHIGLTHSRQPTNAKISLDGPNDTTYKPCYKPKQAMGIEPREITTFT